MNNVVCIPAYKPDHRLLDLVEALENVGLIRIVLADDGSGSEYTPVFCRAEEMGCTIVHHAHNIGKGAALRTGIEKAVHQFGKDINVITATGVSCNDTQTGLRGIPASLIPLALRCKGDRYDYEMNFLTEAVKSAPLLMIPIETVYEDGNKGSHFRPVRDSFLIYREPLKKAGIGLAAAGLIAIAADIVIRMTRE